jgi:serine/threonine-protein kinase RsbW
MNTNLTPTNQFRRIISTSTNDAVRLIDDARLYLSGLHDSGLASEVDFNTFQLVIDEVISNAIVHGNQNNPEKKIALKIIPLPNNLIITVKDEGPGFSPNHLQDPRGHQNLCKPGGRGLFILRNLAQVSWNDLGNCITVRL